MGLEENKLYNPKKEIDIKDSSTTILTNESIKNLIKKWTKLNKILSFIKNFYIHML